MRAIYPPHLIRLDLIIVMIMVKNANYEVPDYVISSRPQLLLLSKTEIFSLGHCSHTS
jgi:hypothetical protein